MPHVARRSTSVCARRRITGLILAAVAAAAAGLLPGARAGVLDAFDAPGLVVERTEYAAAFANKDEFQAVAPAQPAEDADGSGPQLPPPQLLEMVAVSADDTNLFRLTMTKEAAEAAKQVSTGPGSRAGDAAPATNKAATQLASGQQRRPAQLKRVPRQRNLRPGLQQQQQAAVSSLAETAAAAGHIFGEGYKWQQTENTETFPKNAVGHLWAGPSSTCTAVYISESVAITAAHCVLDERTRTWLRPSSISFVPGRNVGGKTAVHKELNMAWPSGIPYGGHTPHLLVAPSLFLNGGGGRARQTWYDFALLVFKDKRPQGLPAKAFMGIRKSTAVADKTRAPVLDNLAYPAAGAGAKLAGGKPNKGGEMFHERGQVYLASTRSGQAADEAYLARTRMDVVRGCSGSPVFDPKTSTVEGIVISSSNQGNYILRFNDQVMAWLRVALNRKKY